VPHHGVVHSHDSFVVFYNIYNRNSNYPDADYSDCQFSRSVQCKEVKKHNKFISVIMLLIERHVSPYQEAFIRFNNFQLYETSIFHGIALLDVEISSIFVWQYKYR